MQHVWVIDVLSQLREYAKLNGLPCLAAEVERALPVAQAEINGDGASANASACLVSRPIIPRRH